MPRPARSLSAWTCGALIALALVLPAAEPRTPVSEWKFEVLHQKNGRILKGLVLKETADAIEFQAVLQAPGRPTHTVFTRFSPEEVARIDRLGGRDRETLAARLKALDPGGEGEKRWMRELELKRVPWGQDGKQALSYPSDHFVLISDAREDIVRRAAVRLEQIYGAYARFLPPRRSSADPTTIRLVQSLAEYRAMMRGEGRDLLNPAFYDPAGNRIVCASDLERLGDQLQRAEEHHRQVLEDLKHQEAELRRLYDGKVPAGLMAPIQKTRKQVHDAEVGNRIKFDKETPRLFQLLYHEAFHAYLANFVYSPAEAEVPRWLNEGLAQIFETAIVEAGELRVGHADAERLARVKTAVRRGELTRLTDLLRSGPRQFLVVHASDQRGSDRAYLTSWALAFYLTFHERLLGTPRLDAYVHALKRGADPLVEFQRLVGKPLPQFEKEFHQYLLDLRADGTVKK
jgi:hypothetical protein